MSEGVKPNFSAGEGKRLYDIFAATVEEYHMTDMLRGGVLLGLSGGADSVFLLHLLLYDQMKNGAYPLLAVHLDHGIRAEEAARDLAFCRELCQALGVEFYAEKVDVPALAKEWNMGWEETARKLRYSLFDKIISSRNDLSVVVTAHNATDQLETVLQRLMRGAGTLGLCGIAPVRGQLLRPMLAIPKGDVTDFLCSQGIPFMTDSTNADTSYLRNYIRHEILPALAHITPSPEAAVLRASKNLAEDEDCLRQQAEGFLSAFPDGKIPASALHALHGAVRFRVIDELCRRVGGTRPERVHARAIAGCLAGGGDFSLDLPGGICFVCKGGICFPVARHERENETALSFRIPLGEGETVLPEYGACFLFSESKKANISSNVYNFSIQADLSSAIIVDSLYVRTKLDGDCYFFGGMTHKLKKMFNDRHIPPALRSHIPVVCDGRGILWVPGFGVRDDGVRRGIGGPYLTMYLCTADDGRRLFCGNEFLTNKAKDKKGLDITE